MKSSLPARLLGVDLSDIIHRDRVEPSPRIPPGFSGDSSPNITEVSYSLRFFCVCCIRSEKESFRSRTRSRIGLRGLNALSAASLNHLNFCRNGPSSVSNTATFHSEEVVLRELRLSRQRSSASW